MQAAARRNPNKSGSIEAALRTIVLLSTIAAAPAQSAVSLLAVGALPGTADLSGLTGTLESGVAANGLVSLGSGLA